ncbi:MAG: S8 family serine peptidase [Bacteroidetes bacterium]|nr:S8 family serine peptidase [Bacteroidota bacterium]
MYKLLCSVIFCIVLATNVLAQTNFQVGIQSGKFIPENNQGLFTSSQWDEIPSYRHHKYVLIQFEKLPDAKALQLLQFNNIELLSYLPTNTYYAKVEDSYTANRFEHLHIRSVIALQAKHKIHLGIQTKDIPHYATKGNDYLLMISLYDGIQANEISASLIEQGAKILNIYNQQHVAIQILPNAIEQIANLPFVQFIDYINAPAEKENIRNKTDHRSNTLNTDYGAGRHFDGLGVRVALTDDGFIGPHIDYQGRTFQDAVIGNNTGNHGDHCAGTIMSAGNLDPLGRGMAPACNLWVYEAISSNNYILDDTIYTDPSLSIDIVSTSYSDGCNTGYNAGAESADRQISTYKNIMRVFSAGNNGTQNCSYGAGAGWGNITGGVKSSKNLIAVANLDYKDVIASSSSRGPATDGRLKPDVSGVGTDVYSTIDPNDYELKTGTSMSCPGVAGTLAQLYQAYRDMNAGTDPNMGLIKNILMNTCDDIGNPGPDFKHGYGRINGLRAVKLLENAMYFDDSVNTSGVKTFTLNIPNNTQRVKIMLNWLDVEASVGATTALVNDLDLVVTDPLSTTYLPWVLNPAPVAASLNANAVRAADHLNNAEQVTIDNPMAGNYTLSVQGFAVPFGPQAFYISYELIANNALEITYPIGGEGFKPGEVQTLRWDAISNGSTYSLDYSTDGGSSWNSIVSSVIATQNYFDWTVPNTYNGNCRVRVNRGATSSESPANFSIMNIPANLQIASVCPDTITITWSPTANATSYDVYLLGVKYMNIAGSTSDTFYHFTGLNSNDEHWFSVTAKNSSNNAVSRRAFAINQVPGLANCILQYDAEVSASTSPGNATLLNCVSFSSIPVSITIKNNGINSMSNIPVSYRVNSLSPVNEVYTGTIAAGAQANYTFTTSISSLPIGNNQIKTWCAYTGDQYHGNDSLAQTVILANSSIASLPWKADFESDAICAGVNFCDNTSCSLLNGLVNEQNLVMDQFDWKVNEGSTPTTVTGPDVDHTLGTASGNYVYTESSYCFNQSAFLLTPCFSFSTTSKPYLRFWYHMYGVDQGTLHVDAFVNGAWQLDIMPAKAGSSGNLWVKQVIDLNAYVGQTAYFRFRGFTGGGSKSDLALDDIEVIDSAVASAVNDIQTSFSIFPNPATQFIEINASHNQNAFDEICMYNALGEMVYCEKSTSPIKQKQVSVSNFANGIYWMVLKSGDEVVFRNKWLKQ